MAGMATARFRPPIQAVRTYNLASPVMLNAGLSVGLSVGLTNV